MRYSNQPLVSICIPTYNGEQYIAEAMDSALAQTYPNLEIIVSDDASSDSTIAIVETYKSKTKVPIHVFHHKPNGIGANWNNCIKNANGEYIKFLFQDDVLSPNCIEVMMMTMIDNPNISLVACKRNFIIEEEYLTDETKKWIELYSDLQENLELNYIDDIAIVDKTLFKHPEFLNSPLNKIGEPSAILFRKKLIKKIGFYREDLTQILDYEFCYRIIKHSSIAILSKKLVSFRLHNEQTTMLNKNKPTLDYSLYDEIIFKNYFWLLSMEMKLYFIKKFRPYTFSILKKLRLLP